MGVSKVIEMYALTKLQSAYHSNYTWVVFFSPCLENLFSIDKRQRGEKQLFLKNLLRGHHVAFVISS